MPAYSPMRSLSEAARSRIDASKAERQQRVQRAVDEARTDWEVVLARFSAAPAVVAILDLHRPTGGYDRVECAECKEAESYDEIERAPWPCNTFAAIKGVVS